MKKLLVCCAFICSSMVFSQAYMGAGDIKFQLGANIQSGGSGIAGSLDFGLGDNISLGVYSVYLLGVQESLEPEFIDRFDIQGRFNANLGNVFSSNPAFDIYPGLHLGLKNFGGHLGVRYFFAPGFGLFSEVHVPIAYYKADELTNAEELNNQLTFTIGMSFNI